MTAHRARWISIEGGVYEAAGAGYFRILANARREAGKASEADELDEYLAKPPGRPPR